ncbi:hypothetical protein ACOSQ3_021914 [Xanthoceras sorbifolium]
MHEVNIEPLNNEVDGVSLNVGPMVIREDHHLEPSNKPNKPRIARDKGKFSNNSRGDKDVEYRGLSRGGLYWIAPQQGGFKMNTNASFNHSSNRAGFGVIIRDSDGQVLLVGASPLLKEFNLQTAEDMAVRWGLILSRDFGLLPIEIESDTQEVVKSINSRICPLSDAVNIISDILDLLLFSITMIVSFVGHVANQVTDGLAKLGQTLYKDSIWLEKFPHYVAKLVLDDFPF